jgi:hypothetical protein
MVRLDLQFGDKAHQTDARQKTTIDARYTGRLPNRMAVGEATILPMPKPSMYRPVVSATCEIETSYVAATSLNPAASTGVMPPPTMQ